jgi:hypothetical protein
LCPPIPLCLLLKTLDGLLDFRVVVPIRSGTLLEDPPTRGTNALAQFRKTEHFQQFSVDCLALLFQGLDLPCDL